MTLFLRKIDYSPDNHRTASLCSLLRDGPFSRECSLLEPYSTFTFLSPSFHFTFTYNKILLYEKKLLIPNSTSIGEKKLRKSNSKIIYIFSSAPKFYGLHWVNGGREALQTSRSCTAPTRDPLLPRPLADFFPLCDVTADKNTAAPRPVSCHIFGEQTANYNH